MDTCPCIRVRKLPKHLLTVDVSNLQVEVRYRAGPEIGFVVENLDEVLAKSVPEDVEGESAAAAAVIAYNTNANSNAATGFAANTADGFVLRTVPQGNRASYSSNTRSGSSSASSSSGSSIGASYSTTQTFGNPSAVPAPVTRARFPVQRPAAVAVTASANGFPLTAIQQQQTASAYQFIGVSIVTSTSTTVYLYYVRLLFLSLGRSALRIIKILYFPHNAGNEPRESRLPPQNLQSKILQFSFIGASVRRTNVAAPANHIAQAEEEADYDYEENRDKSYNFAFDEADSRRQETADEAGNVRGQYSYVNAEGNEIVVRYSASKDGGFIIENQV